MHYLWGERRDEAVGEVQDADARVREGPGLEGADGVAGEAGVVDVLEVEEGAGGEDGDVVLPQQEGVQTETTLQEDRYLSFKELQRLSRKSVYNATFDGKLQKPKLKV